MSKIINRAKIKGLCHELGKQPSAEYLDQLEYRVASMIRGHCHLAGKKRLDGGLVGIGIRANGGTR